jgi:hypothetical protein
MPVNLTHKINYPTDYCTIIRVTSVDKLGPKIKPTQNPGLLTIQRIYVRQCSSQVSSPLVI